MIQEKEKSRITPSFLAVEECGVLCGEKEDGDKSWI
jgi:hypothetical protein